MRHAQQGAVPFIEKAIASLDDILTRMQAHQQQKSAQLRALHWRQVLPGNPPSTR